MGTNFSSRSKRVLSLLLALIMVTTLIMPTPGHAATTDETVELTVGESTKLTGYSWLFSTTWTSSDETVATVGDDGTVTAVSVGTATVTATRGKLFGLFGGGTTTYTIIVTDGTTEALTVTEGQTLQLTVDGDDGTVSWSSSDEAVATVDENGLVTGVSEGDVTITATITKTTRKGFWFFWWGSTETTTTTETFEVCVLAGEEEPVEPEPITYTVTFETNGGSAVEAQVVEEGMTVTKPADPVKKGHDFIGWYTEAELITPYDFTTPIIADITLYASWSVNGQVYQVVFDLRIDGIIDEDDMSEYEPQYVVEGYQPKQPATPMPIIGEFTGWYRSPDCEEMYDFSESITADTIVYAGWYFDATDSDNDDLPDKVEEYLGLDPSTEDTDGDGLKDRTELEVGTDPKLFDTDGDGLSDYDEDADGDGLTNGLEYIIGTSLSNADTDFDTLTDLDEYELYHTSPVLQDTDGDGAGDGWELSNGFDPLVFDESFLVSSSSGDIDDAIAVTASVEIELDGDQAETLVIKPVTASENRFISAAVAGYLGVAYDFSVDETFETATLTFEYDPSLGVIGEDFQPRIYYFNEVDRTFEELENQTVTNGRVVATVTHFSTYILLNKVEFDKVWVEDIRVPTEGSVEKRLDIAFVIDASGSMSHDSKPKNDVDGIRMEVAKEMVSKLSEDDRGMVIKFATDVTLLSNFTSDKSLLIDAIDSVDSYGRTAMYDAVDLAIDLFESGSSGDNVEKIIIVLTDGVDNCSNATMESTSERAIANGITIYSVGLGSSLDEEALIELAESTDGKYYYASVADDLYFIFEKIEDETIDYTTDSNGDGISDYYTQMIYEGKLLPSNRSTEFAGIDFNYDMAGNLSADFDGDGLLNGEELQIVEVENGVQLVMIADPMMSHSDDDGLNDYDEVSLGMDPLAGQDFSASYVDLLLDDSAYYYESYVDNVYDDSLFYQADSAFLAVIFGVWDLEELARDIMIDYFDTYTEVLDDSTDKYTRSIFIDNLDNLLALASDGKNMTSDTRFYLKAGGNIKHVISLINGGDLSASEMYTMYSSCAETVKTVATKADVFKVIPRVMNSKAAGYLGTAAKKLSSKTAGIVLNVAGGVIDIADTVANYARVDANSKAFEDNLDILLHLRDSGSRRFVADAAGKIVEFMADGYSVAYEDAAGDAVEMTVNVALTLATVNPYFKAIKFARDSINIITGIKDSLKYEYKMLAYSSVMDSIRILSYRGAVQVGTRYYVSSEDGLLFRMLTHAAQLRILGERQYETFYTTGIVSWGVDDEMIHERVEENVNSIHVVADYLGLRIHEDL